MRIRISDERLRNGELNLDVTNFCTDGIVMVFSLDGERYFTDFVVPAVKNGMVQRAFRNAGANSWMITMDAKYLTGLFSE